MGYFGYVMQIVHCGSQLFEVSLALRLEQFAIGDIFILPWHYLGLSKDIWLSLFLPDLLIDETLGAII